LDEVDSDLSVQRTTAHNEFIDADNPQTPEEVIWQQHFQHDRSICYLRCTFFLLIFLTTQALIRVKHSFSALLSSCHHS